jgi:SWI/SNF-related matrix-associated actin-dependent regulator 1 of chromatin subfamily A
MSSDVNSGGKEQSSDQVPQPGSVARALTPHFDRLAALPPGLLYPHQVDGVVFLMLKKRALLGDDMGLGKTRQAIVALEMAAPEGSILIVCPASLKLNWRREILMVDPNARIEVLGSKSTSADNPRWVIVNYDLLGKYAGQLHSAGWTGVVLDEAHFIKNASARTSHCLKLMGVQDQARAPLIGPEYVFLLTGTPMTNRPRDLFNLLRCVGHPAARSFLSFAKRYCDAYRNDYGWVTTGASNLDGLNLLMKEVMLRRLKGDVLDLPPKIRTWVPVDISGSAAALNAVESFLSWYQTTDPEAPNDTHFLARLTKVRIALHKAKHKAVAERIEDVLATGDKVVVFTVFNDGVMRHAKALGEAAVTITGAQSAEERMEAVDRFQSDPNVRVAICNIIAGGVGITLTAGTHVIFQDLDWTPANHAQAEDRCYRLGQNRQVTVEYCYAEGSLDAYIARLLEAKMKLIMAVEAEEAPATSILTELEADLRRLAPALIEEVRLARSQSATSQNEGVRISSTQVRREPDSTPIEATGLWEFTSERDPGQTYRVTYGRAGHLECTCKGFEYRGDCKHVREARQTLS